jgi:hypothetical protein
MEEDRPILVDIDVPDAVLLPLQHAPAAPEMRHPNDCDAVWYRAHASALTIKDGAVAAWRPENGLGADALPVKPNENNGAVSEGGGIVFLKETNCGYVAAAALVETHNFCCAVRLLSPEGEARTLITINPDSDTYLFLAEKDGQVIWQDQSDSVGIALPAPGSEYWVAAGYSDGQLSLAVAEPGAPFGDAVQSTTPSTALENAMAGVNDLFIGCRSHRKGIVKTLGQSTIFDILLWIDRNPLSEDPAALAAACRFAETGEDAP